MTSEKPESKFLDKWELEVVLFVEKYHSVSGVVPPDSDILDYVNSLKPHWDYGREDLNALKTNELFQASMRKRGIYIGPTELNLHVGQLSSRQMGAAAVMMDLLDRRSDAKKLRDMGISTEEWSTWIQDKAFSNYLSGRAELLIGNSQHEAHIGLIRSVRSGNLGAIKYFNELTGRFKEDADSSIDTRALIGRILEIIQKHVKDPEVLGALGSEMGQVLFEASQIEKQPSIRGELL